MRIEKEHRDESTFTVDQDVRIPGTDIILEAGDTFKVISETAADFIAYVDSEAQDTAVIDNYLRKAAEGRYKKTSHGKFVEYVVSPEDWKEVEEFVKPLSEFVERYSEEVQRDDIDEETSPIQETKLKNFRSYNFDDEVSIRELEVFIENDYELYRQFSSIISNIKRKLKSDRYDHSLAPKLWMYLVDAGARKYVKELGSPGDDVKHMFPKADRERLSQMMADRYYDEIMLGEYDN